MPRGGENHAQGGEKIAQGGEKISRALRARRTVYFFPPLGNFSCTPLTMVRVTLLRLSHGLLHHEPYLLPFGQVHLRAKFKAWSRSCYRLGLTTSSTW